MLLGVAILLAFAVAPLCGGDLGRLTQLRFRLLWLVALAFAVQILVVNVLPHGDEGLRSGIHVATYAVLAVAVIANLRIPGMWLIGLGGLSNALAIVANDGVMPASEAALAFAGMVADPEGFTNSGLVADARLAFLGDVMAVPSWVPAANVFSVGDLLLIAGGWVLVHRVAGSRLPWTRRTGPALVLFDASGAVEGVTPEAVVALRRLGGEGIRSAGGVVLPPEAFVVAGRARMLALGRPSDDPAIDLLDRDGRAVRLTASGVQGAGSGPRVALAIS